MILLRNSSGPTSLPLATPGWGRESMVGGYSPGLRGSAAKADPAINTMARHVAVRNFIVSPLIVLRRVWWIPAAATTGNAHSARAALHRELTTCQPVRRIAEKHLHAFQLAVFKAVHLGIAEGHVR